MLKEFTFDGVVMGGTLHVSLVGTDAEEAARVFEQMYAHAREDEMRFSRFLPSSELSELNRVGSMHVSPQLFEVITLGKQLYEETNGACNMLVDISRFGYDEDISIVKGVQRTLRTYTPYTTDITRLVLEKETRTVTLVRGQQIDVGSFLKGYTAEHMAEYARSLAGVIVNLGGDIFVRGYDADNEPFHFEIEHPDGSESTSVRVIEGGIATSGSTRRHWYVGNTQMHHVLNNAGTANPDTDVLSLTVIAPRGYLADAYATAGFVLGSVKGGALLRSKGFHYFFIRSDGSTVASPKFAHAPYLAV